MFNRLTFHKAFSTGSDLWILPFLPKNFWFKKINWYLQFLIHPINSLPRITQPLLINTTKSLPNKSILCLPYQKTNWIQQAHMHWVNLKKPSTRLFLLDFVTKSDLMSDWPQQDAVYNLSYLEDKENG